MKASRQRERFVAVAHPDLERRGQLGEELRCAVLDHHFGMSVFAAGRGEDLATHVMHDEVQAITDAEHGQAEREDLGVGGRCVGIVDRRRSTGEDEAERLEGFDFADGRRAR